MIINQPCHVILEIILNQEDYRKTDGSKYDSWCHHHDLRKLAQIIRKGEMSSELLLAGKVNGAA